MNLETFKQVLSHYEEYLESPDFNVQHALNQANDMRGAVKFIAWLARNSEEFEEIE